MGCGGNRAMGQSGDGAIGRWGWGGPGIVMRRRRRVGSPRLWLRAGER